MPKSGFWLIGTLMTVANGFVSSRARANSESSAIAGDTAVTSASNGSSLFIGSLHQRKVAPEVRDAVRDAEEHGEVRRVHHHDVTGALLVRRQPNQAVELRVAGFGERVRTLHINGLPGEHMHVLAGVLRQRVVRQVRMQAERVYVDEQSFLVEVAKGRERRDVFRPFDYRRTQTPLIPHGK